MMMMMMMMTMMTMMMTTMILNYRAMQLQPLMGHRL